jgi:hypothetical protein
VLIRSSLIIVVAMLALSAAGGAGAGGSRAPALPAPSFRPAVGWWILTTGPTGSDRLAPESWAASDRGIAQLELFNLFKGLRKLTRQGIVIWATTSGKGGPTSVFTKATWPLRLSTFRVDRGWEGQPATNVQQRLRWAAVDGWHLDVRVYFGTQHPSKALLTKAQAELDRLLLPGSG